MSPDNNNNDKSIGSQKVACLEQKAYLTRAREKNRMKAGYPSVSNSRISVFGEWLRRWRQLNNIKLVAGSTNYSNQLPLLALPFLLM